MKKRTYTQVSEDIYNDIMSLKTTPAQMAEKITNAIYGVVRDTVRRDNEKP